VPLRIYNWYLVQSKSSHLALGHICGSLTVRGGCAVSSLGVCEPVLALKFPQIMVVSWGCVWSMMSSMSAVAWVSVMARRLRD
jgi:hypothetical protein